MTESCYGATFVADLERRLACAHADKKLLAELLAAKTGKLDDLVNEFDVCRADLKATRRLNDGHCAAIDDYIEQLNQSAEARSALMVRISGLQDELALLKQQPDAPLRHENDALREDLAYLRRVNADLRTHINESTKTHSTSTAYINSLKDDVAGLRRQLATTQDNLKAAEALTVQVRESWEKDWRIQKDRAEFFDSALSRCMKQLKEAELALADYRRVDAPEPIDTVVLAGWTGMRMTHDLQGNTVFRRTP